MNEPMKLHPVEYATVVWHHTMKPGQPLDEALKPTFWKHVTAQLRPGHEIKVVAEDGTFWAHLYVRSVGRGEVVVALIHATAFDAATAEPEGLDAYVRWRNPSLKYGVFRKSDDECLRDKFDTKQDAYSWAAEREGAVA